MTDLMKKVFFISWILNHFQWDGRTDGRAPSFKLDWLTQSVSEWVMERKKDEWTFLRVISLSLSLSRSLSLSLSRSLSRSLSLYYSLSLSYSLSLIECVFGGTREIETVYAWVVERARALESEFYPVWPDLAIFLSEVAEILGDVWDV